MASDVFESHLPVGSPCYVPSRASAAWISRMRSGVGAFCFTWRWRFPFLALEDLLLAKACCAPACGFEVVAANFLGACDWPPKEARAALKISATARMVRCRMRRMNWELFFTELSSRRPHSWSLGTTPAR